MASPVLRKNYVRSFRLKLGLSQIELAGLLGMRSKTRVSKVELGERKPTVLDCMSFAILFAKRAEEIWPKLDSQVRATLDINLRRLISELDGKQTRSERVRTRARITSRKLQEIVDSLSKRNNQHVI